MLIGKNNYRLMDCAGIRCNLFLGFIPTSRVLIRSCKAREFLLQFSGYTRDRKCIRNPKQLSVADFRQLVCLLEGENLHPLSQMVRRMVEGRQRVAPEPYKEFLNELSRNSPVCGMLQVIYCHTWIII